ncbi:MAG: hypothetical protein JKY94_09255 [Rhodobacteraceae bacterium]|nr:hypothetical protein [Paracoccaceae bacterium]
MKVEENALCKRMKLGEKHPIIYPCNRALNTASIMRVDQRREPNSLGKTNKYMAATVAKTGAKPATIPNGITPFCNARFHMMKALSALDREYCQINFTVVKIVPKIANFNRGTPKTGTMFGRHDTNTSNGFVNTNIHTATISSPIDASAAHIL